MMSALEPLDAAGALDAALAAGALGAEAYAQDGEGIEVRVYEGEVEALTEAAERGVGVRAWIDGRAGYAYGTDLTDDGVRSIAAGAVEAARVADSDEFAGPPDDAGGAVEIEGLLDSSVTGWGTESKVELAQEVERAARADERVVAIEDTVYADEAQRVAIASSSGARGGYESTSCYAYARAIAAENGDDRQTGLGFEVARGRAGSTPARSAARPPIAPCRCSAPRSRNRAPAPSSSTRPSPRASSGSSAASCAPTPCSAVARRSQADSATRSPRLPSPSPTTASTPRAPPPPLRRRGHAAEPHPAGRRRHASHLSPRLYTARREGGDQRSTGNAARSGYRSPPTVSTSNLLIAEGERELEACSPRPATASTSPTSPGCTPASTRSRARSRSVPRAGGSRAASSPRPTPSSRSPRPPEDAVRRPRRGPPVPLGPVRRLGQGAAAADRRDGGRG